MNDEEEVKDLEVLSIIGFDGNIINGLHCHPDGIHLVYPIGNSVTIQNTKTKQQEFLNGHTNTITALALSRSGKYIASGQINHMGFRSVVILWDFETRCLINKHEIHKVRIECVCFTCDDSFLISLGGRDDACFVVYDIKRNEPLCDFCTGQLRQTSTLRSVSSGFAGFPPEMLSPNGVPTGSSGYRGETFFLGGHSSSSTGNASTLCEANNNGTFFLSAGDGTMRYWKIDQKRRKALPNEVNFNKIKRLIYCMAVDSKDEIVYCGTSTGDIAKVYIPEESINCEAQALPILVGCFGKFLGKNVRMPTGCTAECYSQGVRSLILLANGELIVGAGDGLVEHVKEREPSHLSDYANLRVKDPTIPMLISLRSRKVYAAVNSLKLWNDTLIIGTTLCEIYTLDMKLWELKLRSTCHTCGIHDICFPSDCSAVFATCSKDTIRVWNTATSQELLRISVPNFTCSGICFYHNGKGIVSSWNDGTIRAFTPQTGKLMYIIHNAHNKGVNALGITKDALKIVSGGGEGQVRVWDIKPDVQRLRAVLQEHKGPVSALEINNNDDEAASASSDGSCIIWDIIRCVRKNIIFANTLFMAVRYHPSDCQILTTGTNRKIAYWETYDGSMIRDMEGSTAGGLNTIDISRDGLYVVSGGNDQMVKLWKYQEGVATHVGLGHAGIITAAKFSPDGCNIITVSADGGIYRWKNPYTPSEEEPKEAPDVVSVHSEPSETKQAKDKDLDECITKTMKIRCKCGKANCKCPKMRLTTTKVGSSKPRCNYTITVARPAVKKSKSHMDTRKVIKVPKEEIGKNNIYGDYCPHSKKLQ